MSKYQGDEPMLIVRHNECLEWMLFCFPEIMSVFSRKIFLFSKQLQTICSDQITCRKFYSNVEMFDVSAPNGSTHWWRIQHFQRLKSYHKNSFFPQFGVISCCMEEHCYFFSYFTVAGCVFMCQSTKHINS